jgi:hypothetical protein
MAECSCYTRIIFATAFSTHAALAHAEPKYAPNWDAQKCAGYEKTMRRAGGDAGYGRLLVLRHLTTYCGRRDLDDELEELEKWNASIEREIERELASPTTQPPPRGPLICTTDFGGGLAVTTCIEP